MTPERNCGGEGHYIDSRKDLWGVGEGIALTPEGNCGLSAGEAQVSLKERESGSHFKVSAKEPIPPLSPLMAQCNGSCLARCARG